jgi:SnoaL-like polyketide cyclase
MGRAHPFRPASVSALRKTGFWVCLARMNDDAKALYRRWIQELWDGPSDTALETAKQLVSEDFVGHWPEMDVHGPEQLAELIVQTRQMIADLSFRIEVEAFTDGTMVAGRWTGSGVMDNRQHRFVGNDILRLDGPRFTEYWVGTATIDGG